MSFEQEGFLRQNVRQEHFPEIGPECAHSALGILQEYLYVHLAPIVIERIDHAQEANDQRDQCHNLYGEL